MHSPEARPSVVHRSIGWISRPVMAAIVALLFVSAALWVRYGSTVFAEMMLSAWMSCF